MTKGAVDSLTRASSLELSADGIRVNSVNPSFVKTNIYKEVYSKETLDKVR